MRISTRLIAALLLSVGLVAIGSTWFQIHQEKERLLQDLERRGVLLAESLQISLREFDWISHPEKLNDLTRRFSMRERLQGIAIFDPDGHPVSHSPEVSDYLAASPSCIEDLRNGSSMGSQMTQIQGKSIQFLCVSVQRIDQSLGFLTLFYRDDHIPDRLRYIGIHNFIRFVLMGLLISLVTILIIRWSLTTPINAMVEWIRHLRFSKNSERLSTPSDSTLKPLVDEMAELARSLAEARARAAEEARLRLEGESIWTPERLKEYLRRELKEKNLFVVSNREPYMHRRQGRQLDWIIPAGGLVTAIDPVLRACGGTWIAHGSGNADRETVDANDKLQVPPDDPTYTLKRVWLSKEEEQGYYYGFSNEGLWPLCHITHTRPTFRLDDWQAYQRVNEKFAQAVLEEISSEENPLVLIQDYHFALLPLLIKSRRPDARVALFWHIPWANPEVFVICPWKKEILLGLLGGDLVGFQTQFHCNNFLETVDRVLESKINWADFSVERRGQQTRVRPFPISVTPPTDHLSTPPAESDPSVRQEYGITAQQLGVGVDRLDYTKGIPERLLAIERLFEKYPQYIERFTYVELGPPSRIHIPRYQALVAELDTLADRINWRFATRDWKPIVFLKDHHPHQVLNRFYRAADVCLVTSLHDGMNLVAKEFIAARSDAHGVLILSQFTGAALELRDALIVNPYDIENLADTIHQALSMPPAEQAERMTQLRQIVRERNIFRWAANLITALARLRLVKTETPPPSSESNGPSTAS